MDLVLVRRYMPNNQQLLVYVDNAVFKLIHICSAKCGMDLQLFSFRYDM